MRVTAFALFLAGCTSTPGPRPDPAVGGSTVRVAGAGGGVATTAMRVNPSYDVRFDTIHASVDRIWSALPAVFTALAIPLTTADNQSLRFGNEGMKVRRKLGDNQLIKLLDCGRSQIGENADSYEIVMSVLTLLERVGPTTTRVATSVEATGKPIQFAGGETRCRTKGELERQIALALRARFES